MGNDHSLIEKLAGEAFDGYGIYRLVNDRLEVQRVNEGYKHVMGYTAENFGESGFDAWSRIHPEDTKNSVRSCKQAAESGKAVRATVRRYDKNGEILFLDGTHISLGDSEFCIAFNNVTEQHRNKAKLEAIVRNFDGGIALVRTVGAGIEIAYANDNFYSILNVQKDSERLLSMLATVIKEKIELRDTHIECEDGSSGTVRIRLVTTDVEGAYVVVVDDVTGQRAQAKSRIAERTANASAGLYDEVFELDYRKETTKMVYSHRFPERAENAKPLPMNYITTEWAEKYVHPDDIALLNEIYTAPSADPDFTDFYSEVRVMDAFGDGEYHTFGMVIVRSGNDSCMMFSRDKARFDNSLTSAQVAETNRLYKLVAEQTNTTVIEFDHITNTISCSPSIKDYWASKLSREEFADPELFKNGLAVLPDDRGIYTEFLKRLYGSHDSETVTLRLKMADESFKWCRLTITLTRGKNNRVIKSLCMINLVHEEILARLRAEQTDKLLRRTVQHIPIGVGIFRMENGDPTPVYLSDNIFSIFRIRNGSFDNTQYSVGEFMKNNKLEAGSEGEYTFNSIRADGTRFWLNTKYRILEEDGETLMYAAISDVTERVESRRREAVQEQMYQVLLEETGTIVFSYDPEKDELSYMRHNYMSGNEYITVEHIGEDPNSFTLIQEEFRPGFVSLLKTLSENEGTSEIPIKIDEDGYPRRYKAFFKSLCDTDGKIFNIIGKLEDVDDEMARLDAIQAKAMYDSLCVDIFNKATTEELIKAELERSTGGALLMIDVDDFKSINDSLGHMFGDEFLKKFASTVKSIFRDTDIVGRYGGDEFFVFMPHSTAALAEKKGNQILERVTEIEVPMPGGVKSSIGVAAVNPDNRSYKQLLKQADSALYQAKNQGKNCVVLFDRGTMHEGSYRTEEAVKKGRTNIVLSSNPEGAASMMMRVFSILYNSSDINESINHSLELVGKTFDVSRIYVFEDTEDGKYCCNTFEWCNEGVESQIDNLRMVSYEEELGGNYLDNMNDDGIFYCHDINDLSSIQYNILAKQGVKSILQCAIVENGKFRGFVGVDEYRSNRFWTQEQIDAMVFLAKELSIFLLKARSQEQSQSYANTLKSILDNYPQYMYIIDAKTHELLYLNKMTEEVVGKGKLGTECSKLICGSSDLPGCPIRNIQATGMSRSVVLESKLLGTVSARAAEVEWEGKKAYMVNCAPLDER